MNSYVYIKSEPGLWTVGFYDPSGQWHADSDHAHSEEAATRVHYLNGGLPTEPQAGNDDNGESTADLSAPVAPTAPCNAQAETIRRNADAKRWSK